MLHSNLYFLNEATLARQNHGEMVHICLPGSAMQANCELRGAHHWVDAISHLILAYGTEHGLRRECLRHLIALAANVAEQFDEPGGDLERQRPGVAHHPARKMKQPPAHRRHRWHY